MNEFLFGFVSVCVLILAIALWLLRRADKKAGELEAENDALQHTLDVTEANRKDKNANTHMVSNLSKSERSKLREKWTIKH